MEKLLSVLVLALLNMSQRSSTLFLMLYSTAVAPQGDERIMPSSHITHEFWEINTKHSTAGGLRKLARYRYRRNWCSRPPLQVQYLLKLMKNENSGPHAFLIPSSCLDHNAKLSKVWRYTEVATATVHMIWNRQRTGYRIFR